MAKKQQETGLGYKDIKADISCRQFRNLYVFFGEETYLLYKSLGQIQKALIDEVTESFNLHRINQDTFSIEELENAVENLPMMSDHSLVIVEDVDLFSMPEDDRNRISALLNDIPDYCVILFLYITCPWKPDKRKKRLWDAVSENGSIIEFCKRDQSDLIPWIEKQFAGAGKTITGSNSRLLLEITDGTMTSLMGEIEKLISFSCTKEISTSDINTVVEAVPEAVVFRMTDQLSSGQYTEALFSLQDLMKKQEALMILGAVGSCYRRLYAARVLSDCGKDRYAFARIYGLSEYPAKKYMEQARKLRRAYLGIALEMILDTDWKIKNSYDDPNRLLELLIISLAAEAASG